MSDSSKFYEQRRWLFFVGIKALIVKNGKVLVLSSGPSELSSTRRKAAFWDLPGGKVEWGESVSDALHREVMEELGVGKGQLKTVRIFDASVSRIRTSHGIEVPLILITYLCRLRNPRARFRLTDEHASYRWVDAKTAAKLLKVKFSRQFIRMLK